MRTLFSTSLFSTSLVIGLVSLALLLAAGGTTILAQDQVTIASPGIDPGITKDELQPESCHVEAGWPGPDAFGYTGNTVGFNWYGIAATGTQVLLSDDDYAGPFPIGFSFPFYGTAQTQFYISSNGFVSFGAGSSSLANDCPLPNTNSPNGIIALMWDDLDPGDTGDPVYYQSFASCPIGSGSCLIVAYMDFCHYPGGTSCTIAGSWELILYPSGDILIEFLETGDEQGLYSTTGIEGFYPGEGEGLTFACNTSGSLVDRTGIMFKHPELVARKSGTAGLWPTDAVDFDIFIQDGGSQPAPSVTLSDPIPPLLTYVSGSLSCTSGSCWYSSASDSVRWTGPVDVSGVTISFATQPSTCTPEIVNTVLITEPAGTMVRSVAIGPWRDRSPMPGYGAMDLVVEPWPAEYGGNDHLYVVAGYGLGSSAYEYDPENNAWEVLAGNPYDLIDYPVDACFGWASSGDPVIVLFPDATSEQTNLLVYNIADNAWSQRTPPAGFPAGGIWGPDIAVNYEDNVCYISGGATTPGGGNLTTLYAYHPASNTINSLPNFTTPRDFHASWYSPPLLCIAGGSRADTVGLAAGDTPPPYHIPAFTGELPDDGVPVSFGPAPRAAATPSPSPTGAVINANPAFAINLFEDRLYSIPDLANPGTWNGVGTVVGSAFAGDFAFGDFSTLYVISNDAQSLYAVDTATGASTLIGPSSVGTKTWTGLSFDPMTGVMYGCATDGATATLYTVNLGTGALTTIGNIAGYPYTIDIAFDGQGNLYGLDINTDQLIAIDKNSAAATAVGSTGFAANYAQDLDFDEVAGIMYWAAYGSSGELRIIDLSTGASTSVGAFPGGVEVDSFALPVTYTGGDLNSTQCYDVDAGIWHAENINLGPLPARMWGSGDAIRFNGDAARMEWWITAGIVNGYLAGDSYYYSWSDHTWHTGDSLGYNLYRTEAAVANSRVYNVGGSIGSFDYEPLNVGRFACEPEAPDAPLLLAIANADGDGSYLVDWDTSIGATSYRLEEDSNSSFSTPTVRYQGANSRYSVTGQPEGTWYYRVRASNTAGNSPWSNTRSVTVLGVDPTYTFLPLVTRSFTSDPYEPNDSLAQAWGPLTLGTAYRAYFPQADVHDYYYIDVPSTRRLRIDLAVPGALDLDLYLRNAAGTILASSPTTGYGTDESITYTFSSSGRYYLHVYAFAGSGAADSYTLLVTSVP